MHPADRAANAADADRGAFLVLVGMARANERGLTIPGVLRTIPGLPGWTILPAFGGWNGPTGPEEEPSAAVLLYGIHAGTAALVAERLRAAFRETAVPVLSLAYTRPVAVAESLAPALPSHWPPEA